MDIPLYPDFRGLHKQDKAFFDRLFFQYPPEISELTFTNLFAWRNTYRTAISQFEGLILVITKKDSICQSFYPIGQGLSLIQIKKILQGPVSVFIRLPEAVKKICEDDKALKIMVDRDNADYLYSTDNLSRLKGSKYDGKRNLINRFKSVNSYEYSCISTRAQIEECLLFEDEWCQIKDCDHVLGLGQERKAFWEMLKNFFDFNLRGAVIKINARIAAVALAEPLNRDTLVLHILKAKAEFVGLYQVINNEFVRTQATEFSFVNMEQDLGIDGLRKAKESYHPECLINKFTVRMA